MLESYVLGILPSSFGGFTLKRIDNILRSSFAMGSMSYRYEFLSMYSFVHSFTN